MGKRSFARRAAINPAPRIRGDGKLMEGSAECAVAVTPAERSFVRVAARPTLQPARVGSGAAGVQQKRKPKHAQTTQKRASTS